MLFESYREPDDSVWLEAAAAAMNYHCKAEGEEDEEVEEEDVTVNSVRLEDGVKKGGNFTSVMKRAFVEAENVKRQKKRTLRFMCKLPPPPGSEMAKMFSSMALFEREAVFYSKMLPEMRGWYGEKVKKVSL